MEHYFTKLNRLEIETLFHIEMKTETVGKWNIISQKTEAVRK